MKEIPKVDGKCNAKIDFASVDGNAGGWSPCKSFLEPECYLLYLRNNGFYAQVFEGECLLSSVSPEVFEAENPTTEQPESPLESAEKAYWNRAKDQENL